MHTGLTCQLFDLYIVILKIVCKEQKYSEENSPWKKLNLGFHRVYTWASLCDLFLIMENTEIASYVNDNTPCTKENSIEEVIQKSENAAKALIQ